MYAATPTPRSHTKDPTRAPSDSRLLSTSQAFLSPPTARRVQDKSPAHRVKHSKRSKHMDSLRNALVFWPSQHTDRLRATCGGTSDKGLHGSKGRIDVIDGSGIGIGIVIRSSDSTCCSGCSLHCTSQTDLVLDGFLVCLTHDHPGNCSSRKRRASGMDQGPACNNRCAQRPEYLRTGIE